MFRLTAARVCFQMRLDRTGDVDVRRCGLTDPSPASSEDRAHPGLPDMELFTFAGGHCLY